MKLIKPIILSAFLISAMTSTTVAHEEDDPISIDKPIIENLMSSALEGAENMEVILSHVTLPPNLTLPKHWHPGEEFA